MIDEQKNGKPMNGCKMNKLGEKKVNQKNSSDVAVFGIRKSLWIAFREWQR